jgi:hypothetical protein
MSRARDVAKQGGLTAIVPTSIVKGASGSASVAANGAVTFTGTEFVTLNGVFTSTYDNYKFVFSGYNPTGQHALTVQLSSAGTPATGANYRYASYYNAAASSSGANFSNVGQTAAVVGQMLPAYVNGNIWVYDIYGPSQPYVTNAIGGGNYSDGSNYLWTGAAWSHTVNTSYDGIKVMNGSSSTMSGTVRIYGYNNGA